MSRHSSGGSKWKKLRLQILARDNHTCAYCGGEATTIDHIIPKAKGGSDTESNLIACCRTCNTLKSDKALQRIQWINSKYKHIIKNVSSV